MSRSPLYEDSTCVVIAKPAGIATLHDERSSVPSIETPYAPFHPVHRLDNDTTGCVLLAKTDEAYKQLRAQFDEQRVTKIYVTLVHGLTPQQLHITTPIAHHARKADRMTVVTHLDAPHRGQSQPADTTLTTLHHCYPTATCTTPVSWIRVQISTGVRHQIRVHLASIGHAIVGDVIYAEKTVALAAPHHLLHAWQLVFQSPATEKTVTVTAPLPHIMYEVTKRYALSLPVL